MGHVYPENLRCTKERLTGMRALTIIIFLISRDLGTGTVWMSSLLLILFWIKCILIRIKIATASINMTVDRTYGYAIEFMTPQ